MKRKIIHIDAELCNGCGNCIPNCPEGALQMIDGKARLVSDLFCDGLGACIGECPLGAIAIEEREAAPYNERQVMENIVKAGDNTIRAHLQHLASHGETGYLEEARAYLREQGIAVAEQAPAEQAELPRGCPGSQARELRPHGHAHEHEPARERAHGHAHEHAHAHEGAAPLASELAHWPVQLHLIPPNGPAFRQADVLLSADCVAYAFGDFHRRFLAGRSLAIACPKLDGQQDVYLDKLTALIDFAGIRSLTVLTMEVPCCRGLLQLALQAAGAAKRKIPVKWLEISVQGEILREQELAA
jgi:Pyruvate/2-oxoacid:ferredoxin oxidoreductase delta subunit